MAPDPLLERLCAPASDPVSAPVTALVAAHPDDETLGAGGRFPRLNRIRIFHVTDGSPRDLSDAHAAGCATREEYAEARRRELAAVLRLAGIRAPAEWLGCVDQEASFALSRLATEVAARFAEIGPEVALTLSYEGGHPDHDAAAFAVHAACALLRSRGSPAPAIVEFGLYRAPGGEVSSDGVWSVDLSEEELRAKQELVRCFATQARIIADFPLSPERFRRAPAYDFTQPPHPGPLFYESRPWGVTGEQWRALAGEALAELGISERT